MVEMTKEDHKNVDSEWCVSGIYRLRSRQQFLFLIEDIPLCLDSKSKTEWFKVILQKQQFINISILLWQHVSVLLDHLQASI